jgi:hypothetical protein
MNDIVIKSNEINSNNITNENQWKRNCPKCGKELFYSLLMNRNRAERRGSICYKCSYNVYNKGPWNKGIKTGLVLTPEQKERHRNALRAAHKPYHYIYTKLKNQAKYRKIECSITYEEFLNFTKIDKCKYCGDNIVWEEHIESKTNRGGYKLDRKDNSLGYTKDNCVVCCKKCNWMKLDHVSYDLMIKLGKVIKEHREFIMVK